MSRDLYLPKTRITAPASGTEENVGSRSTEDDATADSLPPVNERAGGSDPTLPAAPAQSFRRDRLARSLPQSLGDYELLEEIARGGMGVVFRARQNRLNRIVAVKMIAAGKLATPQDSRRFRAEAEAVANLDHPNIVPIYEVGECDGQPFFSMKYIAGGSLAQQLRSRRGRSRVLRAPRIAAEFMIKAARAVHHAHQHGILHRDLKPGNILVDADRQPFVTDFGMARRVEGPSDLTRTGELIGTPSYMAPEQAEGRRTISTAADVYSFGAILFEMMTGRPPFRDETPLLTIRRVIEDEPPSPRSFSPNVDRDMEAICLKCLEKSPKHRYASGRGICQRPGALA